MEFYIEKRNAAGRAIALQDVVTARTPVELTEVVADFILSHDPEPGETIVIGRLS